MQVGSDGGFVGEHLMIGTDQMSNPSPKTTNESKVNQYFTDPDMQALVAKIQGS